MGSVALPDTDAGSSFSSCSSSDSDYDCGLSKESRARTCYDSHFAASLYILYDSRSFSLHFTLIFAIVLVLVLILHPFHGICFAP